MISKPIVDSAQMLLIAWLGDAEGRSRYGENGRRVVERNRGALDRVMALVEQLVAPRQEMSRDSRKAAERAEKT